MLIVTAILAVVGFGCDGHSQIAGGVYDKHDRPVSGAMVVFELVEPDSHGHREEDHVITDESGRFSLGFTHSPWDDRVSVCVRKEGYKPYCREMTTSETRKIMDQQHEMKVVLEKEPEP